MSLNRPESGLLESYQLCEPGALVNVSEFPIPHLQDDGNDTCFTWLLQGLSESFYFKVPDVPPRRCLIYVIFLSIFPLYAYRPATSISLICKADAVNFIRLDFPLSIYPYSLARRTDAQRY